MRPAHHTYLVSFLTLLSIVVFAGCIVKPKPATIREAAPVIEQPAAAVEEDQQPKMEYEAGDEAYPDGYYIHTVRVPGENISVIARWYTGEQKNWSVLAKCNPKIKPNHIFIGNQIKVPRSIMTRKIPLPPEFIKQSQAEPQRKKKKKSSSTKTKTTLEDPVNEEAPLLFGPKGY